MDIDVYIYISIYTSFHWKGTCDGCGGDPLSERPTLHLCTVCVCEQESLGEARSQKKGNSSDGHVPQKGEVLEFEMSEPTAAGGVEWLAGTVLQVDLKKQTFKVIIKEDEDDKDTWSKETYKVAS